jgi:hypothetical protein
VASPPPHAAPALVGPGRASVTNRSASAGGSRSAREHALGRAQAALFEAHDVVDADRGQLRDSSRRRPGVRRRPFATMPTSSGRTRSRAATTDVPGPNGV